MALRFDPLRRAGGPRKGPPRVVLSGVAKSFGHPRAAFAALDRVDLRCSRRARRRWSARPAAASPRSSASSPAWRRRPPAWSRSTMRRPTPCAATGQIAVAFQDPSLLPWRSVRSNVALARKLARLPADRALVDDLIARVGLAGFEQTASGGTVRRHAPAHGDRPLPRHRAAPDAARRALRRGRRADPPPPQSRTAAALGRAGNHNAPRHAFHSRGRAPLRPGPRHEPAPGTHRRRHRHPPAAAAHGRGHSDARVPRAGRPDRCRARLRRRTLPAEREAAEVLRLPVGAQR